MQKEKEGTGNVVGLLGYERHSLLVRDSRRQYNINFSLSALRNLEYRDSKLTLGDNAKMLMKLCPVYAMPTLLTISVPSQPDILLVQLHKSCQNDQE
jgi:hypothetical protein